MKVISKETAPKAEFGDKVRVKERGHFEDLQVGEIGVVTEFRSGGKLEVHTAEEYDVFNPEALEVLQKFSGEEVEAEKSVTVELTALELKHIVADMANNSIADTERGLEVIGFLSDMNAAVAQRTYSDLKDLLMEVA